jgi:methionyl-tRNA formyltransferase
VRLVFLGTPEFAVPTLEACVAAGHEVLAVLTQPDRPQGRGQHTAAPPVKRAALGLGLRVEQPERIRTPEVLAFLNGLAPEAMVVVGYGKIIPQSLIDIPPHGVINVHASLLPKYRGAAPIQWAVAKGETVTGVTTMRIDAGLDTGDILLQSETPIGLEETALDLAPRLARMGADLLVETLALSAAGRLVRTPQDHSNASLAPILKKEDGEIDWTRRAPYLYNRIRGFLPWPGCATRFRGRRLQVWRARLGEGPAGQPGRLETRQGRLLVGCGEDTSLELLEVQVEGKKRMTGADFLNGYQIRENERLEMNG